MIAIDDWHCPECGYPGGTACSAVDGDGRSRWHLRCHRCGTDDPLPGAAVATGHAYTSTACVHGECGSCRETCKYCDESCQHGCHSGGRAAGESWVDQARGIAAALLDSINPGDMPAELRARIAADPRLFWLREEEGPS